MEFTWLAVAFVVMAGAWGLGRFVEREGPPAGDPGVGEVTLPSGATRTGYLVPRAAGTAWASPIMQGGIAVTSLALALGPAFEPARRVVFGVAGLLLAIQALSALPGWRGPAPCLALTPEGILVRSLARTTWVPWSAVTEVFAARRRGLPWLCIRAPRRRRSGHPVGGIESRGWGGWSAAIDRWTLPGDLNIDLSGYQPGPDELVALVQRCWQRPEARPGLAVGSIEAGEDAGTPAATVP